MLDRPRARRFASTILGILLPAAVLPAQVLRLQTGFEELAVGEFRLLETAFGRISAPAGNAAVDGEHTRSGSRSLHLLGGDRRTVQLQLSPGDRMPSELSFWAERWTRREPFEFGVDVRRGDEWEELYRGDDSITVGGFHTEVRVPLDGEATDLRLWCTSRSGVLIDDLRIGIAGPMEVAGVTTQQDVVPCLIGHPGTEIGQIEIEVFGSDDPLELRRVRIDLAGTSDLSDVASVELIAPDGEPFDRARRPAAEIEFRGRWGLRQGIHRLSVLVRVSDGADIDHFVDFGCVELRFGDGRRLVPQVTHPPGRQRIGVALRQAGDDGARGYRIPGLVTTESGVLLAVYDVRWRGMGDLPGDIDVGLSRSLDGGRTWEPMRVIVDMGRDEDFAFDGVGDPSILVDRETGTVWVAALWSHGDRAWNGSGPGLDPDETGQLVLVRSDDDGRTWSKPVNITAQVKKPEWRLLLQGPGTGIQMRDGTLVFPAQFRVGDEARGLPYSTILFSRDHGQTWKIGRGARPDTTESQVVETEPGVLMLNMRDNRGGSRAVATTSDLGETWTEHPSSRVVLVEPVCNASLIRVNERELLFVNPAVPTGPRRRMTIRWSPDLGETWPADRSILLDSGTSAGYPSATMIDGERVGVLFECSAAMLAFVRVPISELRN